MMELEGYNKWHDWIKLNRPDELQRLENLMDDFDELKEDPVAWIMSNIEDDLAGIEWVLDDMDANEVLDPAMEAYILPTFEKAGVSVPDRSILVLRINILINEIKLTS